MRLRNLKIKDAPLMLQWMHDPSVVGNLRGNFAEKSIEDCERFIGESVSETNIHLAVVSDEDEYMGTVSLKNIENGYAEFAITVRAQAMRRGYSWYAMREIIRQAFEIYGLSEVYWCVSRANERAVKFYDKHGFPETKDVPQGISKRYQGINNLKWYLVNKETWLAKKKKVAGCKVVQIRTISADDAGALSFFEGERDFSFDIKRVYYITGVPEGVRRGFHAHKQLKQLLFCPYGRILLSLEGREGKEEIELDDPSVGVIIDDYVWREMLWLQKDSVLCVAASDYYDESDYVRDYQEFRESLKKMQ